MEIDPEDVEVILKGEQHLPCPVCTSKIAILDSRMRMAELDACELCSGWCFILNQRYVKAARNLGLPIPKSFGELDGERRKVERRAIDLMLQRGVKVDQVLMDDMLKKHQ